MTERRELSIVVCTYNRADQLMPAIDALLDQRGHVRYDILIVDNNSTDHTAAVVQYAIDRANGRLRYAFEPKQGLSHARNLGIELTDAPLIAFSDDDVRVASDWVERLVAAFASHADIDYVGGRVLPRWTTAPPEWLTTAHWSPLALQDYGDQPFVTSRERAVCLVGANLAFRRRVFDAVGRFSPDLGRVRDGIGSTEDHDMQLRIWKAGMRGLYQPDIVTTAEVTPDRMTKAYHRRWHRGHGRHCASMRLRDLVPADQGPLTEPANIVRLFGAPAFVYADALLFARRWLGAFVRREDSFFYANKLRHIRSYLQTSRALATAQGWRGAATEVVTFLRSYFRKRRALRMVSP